MSAGAAMAYPRRALRTTLAVPSVPSPAEIPAGRRIALLLTDLNGGGVQKMTLALAGALAARGHHVEIVLYERSGVLGVEIPPEVTVHHLQATASRFAGRLAPIGADPLAFPRLLLPVLLPRKPLRGLKYLPALAEYLERQRPDALISAAPNCNLAAVWAKRLARVPTRVLISERTAPSEMLSKSKNWRARFLPGLMQRTYQQADVIVAVSRALADNLAAVTGIPRTRIKAIYNPVVGPEIAEAAAVAPSHPWFAPDQPPVILAVGRLSDQKDYPTLIQAFAEVRRSRHVRLVIFGAASDAQKTAQRRGELTALATELGVGEDVDVPGFTANPYSYMARAAALVLSSRYEGLPGVLIQAMACGCPVVSTDCPSGPAEILEGGRYGPLVPIGDVPALAAALVQVLDTPLDAETLKRRADDFSVDHAVDGYLDALFRPNTAKVGA